MRVARPKLDRAEFVADPKAPKFQFGIEKGKPAEFKYRIILFSGAIGVEAMNKEADAFADASK